MDTYSTDNNILSTNVYIFLSMVILYFVIFDTFVLNIIESINFTNFNPKLTINFLCRKMIKMCKYTNRYTNLHLYNIS